MLPKLPTELLKALESAGPFFEGDTETAGVFGCLLVVDALPDQPRFRMFKKLAKAGTEAYLEEKKFDPTEYMEHRERADQARASAEQNPASVTVSITPVLKDEKWPAAAAQSAVAPHAPALVELTTKEFVP